MSNETPQESQPGGYDNNPPTGQLPKYEPPPPGSSYSAQPQWATAGPAPVVKWRVRDHMLVALSVAVAMIVVVGLGFMWFGHNLSVQRVADQTPATGANVVQSGPATGADDLTKGAVFLDSNDVGSNVIAAFARHADGTLHLVGRFPTGGKGSGGVEDTSNGLVVASVAGTESPQHMTDGHDFLIVPNLGSSTITIFRIKPHGLEIASTTVSGGEKPTSIAVHNGLVYVLQSGEFDDRFVTSATTFIDNCTAGQLPTVTGFRLSGDGKLTPIPESTRLLSGVQNSGCAQTGFTPDGKYLFVTERIANKTDPKTTFQHGDILSYPVRPDGTLDDPNIIDPPTNAPYSFTFTQDGNTMITANQNGGGGNPHGGQAQSYSVDENGMLTPNGTPQSTQGTDSCWIVLANNQKLAFVSSPFDGGSVASFRLESNGAMTMLHPQATSDDGVTKTNNHLTDGILDITLSHDSQYLYGLDGLTGGVWGFKVNDNGTLNYIEKVHVFNVLGLAAGGQGGPNGIAAY